MDRHVKHDDTDKSSGSCKGVHEPLLRCNYGCDRSIAIITIEIASYKIKTPKLTLCLCAFHLCV